MVKSGDIILFSFPQTNLAQAKMRPALLIQRLPGKYDDWLTCMISSKVYQEINGFDEIVSLNDRDFHQDSRKFERN